MLYWEINASLAKNYINNQKFEAALPELDKLKRATNVEKKKMNGQPLPVARSYATLASNLADQTKNGSEDGQLKLSTSSAFYSEATKMENESPQKSTESYLSAGEMAIEAYKSFKSTK